MNEVMVSIIVPAVTAIVTALATLMVQKSRLRNEFELDREKIRTGFMAERVTNQLLQNPRWKMRSFKEIKKRLGGFDDNELRQILVRAGAVRFEEKSEQEELWGLIERNHDAV